MTRCPSSWPPSNRPCSADCRVEKHERRVLSPHRKRINLHSIDRQREDADASRLQQMYDILDRQLARPHARRNCSAAASGSRSRLRSGRAGAGSLNRCSTQELKASPAPRSQVPYRAVPQSCAQRAEAGNVRRRFRPNQGQKRTSVETPRYATTCPRFFIRPEFPVLIARD